MKSTVLVTEIDLKPIMDKITTYLISNAIDHKPSLYAVYDLSKAYLSEWKKSSYIGLQRFLDTKYATFYPSDYDIDDEYVGGKLEG